MKSIFWHALIYCPLLLPSLNAGDITAWPHKFMSENAEVLTTSAKAAYTDASPTQLWREIRFDIDAEGRRTLTERNVYYVSNYTDLETYSHLTTTWLPWYQARPQLRARVLHPDGAIYQLDAAHVVETSATQDDPNQFNQAHNLSAPLPRLMVGAVIETEVVIPAIRPFFAGGEAWPTFFTAAAFPQQIRVSTPTGTTLHFEIDPSCEVDHHVSQSGGQTLQTWTLVTAPEPMTVDQHQRLQTFTRGRIAFATGESWQQVGAAYGAVVDQVAVLDQPPFDLQAQVVPNDARATAARFLREIQKTVRYTGLYLGDKNLMPTPPTEILQRGFGDCKDVSVLLIAMLRKVGFDAQMALVNSVERNLPRNTPGLGIFNHAIVVVRGEQPVWIDTTVSLNREGSLPFELHGTQALIAAQDNAELVTIRAADPAENGLAFDMTFTAQPNDIGSVKIQSHARGNKEIYYRYYFRNQGPPKPSQDESLFETARLLSDDFSKPWTQTLMLKNGDYIKADYRFAAFTLPMGWLLHELPNQLLFEEDQEVEPLFLAEAGTFRLNYHFQYPDGYQLVAPLPKLSFDDHHLKIVHETHPEDPSQGSLIVTLTSGHFDVAELTRINTAIRQALQTNMTQVYYHETHQLFLGENPEQSFAALLRESQSKPSFANHMRLALNFSQWGMVDAAATQIALALAQPHTSKDALAACSLLLKNHNGDELGIGYPRDQALTLLDQEVANFPEEPMLPLLRAVMRDHHANGMMGVGPEQLDRAASDYARLGPENMTGKQAVLYLWNRLWAGDTETAQVLANHLDDAQKTAFLLTALAIRNDVDQVLDQLDKISDQTQRREMLMDVFGKLSNLRHFEKSYTMLERGLSAEDQRENADRMSRWRARHRDVMQTWRDNDPRTPVLRLAVNQLVPHGDKPFTEEQIFCGAPSRNFTQLRIELKYMGFGLVKAALSKEAASQLGILESFLPAIQVEVVADAPNHKNSKLVKLTLPKMRAGYYWVVREGNRYRLAGSLHAIRYIAGAVEHAVSHSQVKPAVKMLDYLLAKEQDHLWDHQNPHDRALWALLKKHNKKALPELLALIGGKTKQPEHVFPRLLAQVENCDDGPLAKHLIKIIAAAQLDHGLIDAGLATYEALYQKEPTDNHALVMLNFYRKTERFEQHAALLAERQKQTALLAPAFRREAIKSLKVQGRLAEVKVLQERECNEFPEDDLVGPNNLAWLHLFLENADLNAAIKRIENHKETSKNSATLHTLATLYATQGRNLQATDALRNAIKVRIDKTLDGDDFYVLGLVAENLGFPDIARAYYTRVEIQEDEPLATEKLARKRLAALADTDTAADVQ